MVCWRVGAMVCARRGAVAAAGRQHVPPSTAGYRRRVGRGFDSPARALPHQPQKQPPPLRVVLLSSLCRRRLLSSPSSFAVAVLLSPLCRRGLFCPFSFDGRSQKAKQKRLISVISLFSLVLERRAAGEKAPSSAHREKAKSAFFLANNGVPLRSVCAAGQPRQRRNFYRRQGAFTHGNGISTCHCTRVLPLYLQLAAAVLSPLPCHQCGHCLLYTSPSPRDYAASRMPSSA